MTSSSRSSQSQRPSSPSRRAQSTSGVAAERASAGVASRSRERHRAGPLRLEQQLGVGAGQSAVVAEPGAHELRHDVPALGVGGRGQGRRAVGVPPRRRGASSTSRRREPPSDPTSCRGGSASQASRTAAASSGVGASVPRRASRASTRSAAGVRRLEEGDAVGAGLAVAVQDPQLGRLGEEVGDTEQRPVALVRKVDVVEALDGVDPPLLPLEAGAVGAAPVALDGQPVLGIAGDAPLSHVGS